MLIPRCPLLTNVKILSHVKNLPQFRGNLARATIVSNTCNVIISKDHDIFSNLAFENWLFTNLKFEGNHHDNEAALRKKSKPLVLIWRNGPALVIGRHQNPWLEGRMSLLKLHNVNLARRQSGGGCVYHDMNNINISLIGHKDQFNERLNNLKFVAKLLRDLYGIRCEPTERNDLVISETRNKITGSAAKLGRFNCYHHFTLLVDTDKTLLYKVIRQNPPAFLETKSSSSVRSKVQNLRDTKKDLTPNKVIEDLAQHYSRSMENTNSHLSNTVKLVQPNDLDFPGYDRMKQDLTEWKWVFGMTPKFILRKNFHYIDNGEEKRVQFEVDIKRGLVDRIVISLNGSEPFACFEELVGDRFIHENMKLKLTEMFHVDERDLDPEAKENRKSLFATFFMQILNDLS